MCTPLCGTLSSSVCPSLKASAHWLLPQRNTIDQIKLSLFQLTDFLNTFEVRLRWPPLDIRRPPVALGSSDLALATLLCVPAQASTKHKLGQLNEKMDRLERQVSRAEGSMAAAMDQLK